MRIHNAVAGTLAKELRATGGHVDVERAMPAMSIVRADGTIGEAIMDVTVWWPGALAWYGIDATVRFAGASRYVGAQCRAGAAAAQAEREKVRRYGRDVLPLAYEAGGRLGPGSESTLQRLADAAVASSAGILSRRGLLAQWRRRLEAALLFASADAILCATGRGTKGAQFAARWGATRPVPAPIADAVDRQHAQAVFADFPMRVLRRLRVQCQHPSHVPSMLRWRDSHLRMPHLMPFGLQPSQIKAACLNLRDMPSVLTAVTAWMTRLLEKKSCVQVLRPSSLKTRRRTGICTVTQVALSNARCHLSVSIFRI